MPAATATTRRSLNLTPQSIAEWSSLMGRIFGYGADESWGHHRWQQYRSWSSWYPGAKFGQLTTLAPQPIMSGITFRQVLTLIIPYL